MAEGNVRRSVKDRARFLDIAPGSAFGYLQSKMCSLCPVDWISGQAVT
ncbi:four helix bundle protein [Neorhodopirellula pilleata]|nr:hypothetical protein [Neorhodopirellula pilleata]